MTIYGIAAEDNKAMAINGRCRSHPMATAISVTDDANKRLAIISPQLTSSLIIGKSSIIKGTSLLHVTVIGW